MTQYPAAPQPGYYAQPPNPRPTAVTVLAILGMVWGAMVILCNLMSMIPLLVQVGPPNPMMDEMRADATLHTWNLVATVARLVLGFVLLIGSGGALALKGWGRLLMLGYAGVAIVISLVDTYMTVAHMLPILRRLATTDPNVQQIMGLQRVGMTLGIVMSLLLPVLVLIIMTRPHVKAAFAGAGAGAAPGGYPQPGYPPGGHAQPGYPPTGYAQGGYPPRNQAPPPPQTPPNGPYAS